MSLESNFFDTIKALVSNRCYPDTAPANTVRPFIVYHQVGGQALNYVENTAPNARHALMQVNVWADTRTQANTIAQQVEDALRAATVFSARPDVAITALYEPDLSLYGTMQDFNVWQ